MSQLVGGSFNALLVSDPWADPPKPVLLHLTLSSSAPFHLTIHRQHLDPPAVLPPCEHPLPRLRAPKIVYAGVALDAGTGLQTAWVVTADGAELVLLAYVGGEAWEWGRVGAVGRIRGVAVCDGPVVVWGAGWNGLGVWSGGSIAWMGQEAGVVEKVLTCKGRTAVASWEKGKVGCVRVDRDTLEIVTVPGIDDYSIVDADASEEEGGGSVVFLTKECEIFHIPFHDFVRFSGKVVPISPSRVDVPVSREQLFRVVLAPAGIFLTTSVITDKAKHGLTSTSLSNVPYSLYLTQLSGGVAVCYNGRDGKQATAFSTLPSSPLQIIASCITSPSVSTFTLSSTQKDSLSRILPPLRARLDCDTEALSCSLVQLSDMARLVTYASGQLNHVSDSQDVSPPFAPFDPPLRHLTSCAENSDSTIDGDSWGANDHVDGERQPGRCPLIFQNVECAQQRSRDGHYVVIDASFDATISPFLLKPEDIIEYDLYADISLNPSTDGTSETQLDLLEKLRKVPWQSTVVRLQTENLKAENLKQGGELGQRRSRLGVSSRAPVADLLAVVPNLAKLRAHLSLVARASRREAREGLGPEWRTELASVALDPESMRMQHKRKESRTSAFDLSCVIELPAHDVPGLHATYGLNIERKRGDTAMHIKLSGGPAEVLTALSAVGHEAEGSVLMNGPQLLQRLETAVQCLEGEVSHWRDSGLKGSDAIKAVIATDETVGRLLEQGAPATT